MAFTPALGDLVEVKPGLLGAFGIYVIRAVVSGGYTVSTTDEPHHLVHIQTADVLRTWTSQDNTTTNDADLMHLSGAQIVTGVKRATGGLVGDLTSPAVPGHFKAINLLYRGGNKTIYFGDSTTAGSSDMAAGRQGDSYPTYAGILSNHRLQFMRNSGVGGNKTSDMVARIQTDVVAYAPARCLILGGVNDIANAVPFATTVANLTSIVNTLIANEIEPVLCTLCPSNTAGNHAGIAQLNAWIKGFCAANGLSCVDFFSVLVDPTNGNYKAGLTGDGVHPSANLGTAVMGAEAARLVPVTFPAFQPYLAGATDANDVTNLITNGTMQGGGTRATNWVINSGLANTVESLAAAPSPILGQWQVVTFSGATTYDLIQTINVGGGRFSVGDKVMFAGYISLSGFGTNGVTVRVSPTGAASEFLQPIGTLTADISQGLFYGEGIVPASTTSLVVHIIASPTGAAVAKFAQMTLVNLTALGL